MTAHVPESGGLKRVNSNNIIVDTITLIGPQAKRPILSYYAVAVAVVVACT